MTDVTRLLTGHEQGDTHAASLLLPLGYDELRKLAAQRMAQEQPGQTLQPTARVPPPPSRLPQTGNQLFGIGMIKLLEHLDW
jgi:hypothetical protein